MAGFGVACCYLGFCLRTARVAGAYEYPIWGVCLLQTKWKVQHPTTKLAKDSTRKERCSKFLRQSFLEARMSAAKQGPPLADYHPPD